MILPLLIKKSDFEQNSANIVRFLNTLDPRLRGDDGLLRKNDEWFSFIFIPAKAGIQCVCTVLERSTEPGL